MRPSERVNPALLLLLAVCAEVAHCQDVVEQNGTKVVDLQDPSVDATVKSALENGTVSEVVVRKDLLLFPVNAPNLVIAHRQEIHAVPQTNGVESADGKPSAAEVAEVNEYSLSQVVSNDTDNDETESQNNPASESSAVRGPQNDAVLEPGQLLEVPSGFNFSNGLATERVALPDEVQNISVPKQSILDLLSKSLAQPVTSAPVQKRSADSNEGVDNDDGDDDNGDMGLAKRSAPEDGDDQDDYGADETGDSTTTEEASGSDEEVEKRSVDADEDDSKSDSDSVEDTSDAPAQDTGDTGTTDVVKRSVDCSSTEATSLDDEPNDDNAENSKVFKRFVDMNDGDDDDSDTATQYYDHEVERLVSELGSAAQDRAYTEDETADGKDEDMDVAEDIVFRPLFRYRQETRLRQQYSPQGRSGYARAAQANGYDYGNRDRYNQGDSDYD